MNTKTYRANIDCRNGRYDVALWEESSRPGSNDLAAKTDAEAIAELDAKIAAYGWNVTSVYLVHRGWERVR